jgi:hypothetical protein
MKIHRVAALVLITVLGIKPLSRGFAWALESSNPIRVFVGCSGDDALGPRVCSHLREKIRASKGFELVQSPGPGVFCVHIVSMDAGTEPGLQSAYAETYSLGTTTGTELFLTSYVSIVGTSRVAENVDGLFADMDKESEFLRK